MLTVCVYDHDTDVEIGDLVAIFPKAMDGFTISRHTVKSEEAGVVQEMKQAAIAIGHFENADNWENLLDGALRGSVCIRTSTEGFEKQPPQLTDKGVIALYLTPAHSSLNDDDWRLILDALRDQSVAQGVVRGRISPELARFFPPHTVVLPTRSLLCQGYLAVHSDANGLAEGVCAHDVADVCRALDTMGWPIAVQLSELRAQMHEALRDTSRRGPEKRQALREQGYDKAYWAPLAAVVSRISSFAALKATEWDPLCGMSREEEQGGWVQVRRLLSLLKDPGTPGSEAGIVARAYVELAAKMGGRC